MSFAPNFTILSHLQLVQVRDFYVADSTLLNPNNPNPIVDGEWLELNSSYQLARGSVAGNPSWPVFAERGRYDTQAIGKVPVLFIGGYEAETVIVNPTGLTVGAALMPGNVTINALVKRGLLLAATGGAAVGYVTRITTAGAQTKVRFVAYGGFQKL